MEGASSPPDDPDSTNDSICDIDTFINLRRKYINNPILTYYNINSLRNKIYDLRVIISRALPDILVVAETKLDQSFPTAQFLIKEYNEPTRCNRSAFGGDLIEYIRKGIKRKHLSSFELKSFESICSEITIKNIKWFLLSFYRSPNNSNLRTFFTELSVTLNHATSRYDNLIVMGDFNMTLMIPTPQV